MPRPAPNPLHTLPSLCRRFDRASRAFGFRAKTPAEWRRWRAALRRELRRITGIDTMRPAPLRPRVTERVEMAGYTRERIEIATEPGVVMTLYALVPSQGKPPFPAVIAPHGHSSAGKAAVVGDRTHAELADIIDQHNYNYGEQFARAGLIAFCPDARGFGERREGPSWAPQAYIHGSCQWLNQMGYPLGRTVTGMWAWDLMRLIDYIQTRRDCLPGAVGCGGLSGGGLQTLWLAALDDRVRCAVVSGYFYGYKESLLLGYANCSCNFVPHLYERADMGDLGALIAPRPLLVETGDRDALNGPSGLGNVRPQARIARSAYKLLGAEKAFFHHVFHGEHRWCGEKALPWMSRWLGGATGNRPAPADRV